MKTECKTKELVLFFAEVHLILWKDNENRVQNKRTCSFFAEVHLILWKDNENREQ